MSDNIVDISTLSNINRKIEIEKDLSSDINKRKEEKDYLFSLMNEPLRRLEFNILMHICDNTYKPYKNMKLQEEEEYCDYGSPKIRYYVSVPKIELETLLPILDEDKTNINLSTIEYAYNRTRVIFRHKDNFKQFTDDTMFKQNKLYQKLFGITMDNPTKVLYYYLSHYKYDFLDIVQNYPKVYDNIKKLDDFFCYRGYHKRVINNTL